jgi:hypothetical protein
MAQSLAFDSNSAGEWVGPVADVWPHGCLTVAFLIIRYTDRSWNFYEGSTIIDPSISHSV